MTTTYTTRDEAIAREIADAIDARGTDHRDYDLEAIADKVLGGPGQGFAVVVGSAELWAAVEAADVTVHGVTIGEITAALRAADIAYRVEAPGTVDAAVHVPDPLGDVMAFGPATGPGIDGRQILGVDSYAEGAGHDWHATVADAVERAARWARQT